MKDTLMTPRLRPIPFAVVLVALPTSGKTAEVEIAVELATPQAEKKPTGAAVPRPASELVVEQYAPNSQRIIRSIAALKQRQFILKEMPRGVGGKGGRGKIHFPMA